MGFLRPAIPLQLAKIQGDKLALDQLQRGIASSTTRPCCMPHPPASDTLALSLFCPNPVNPFPIPQTKATQQGSSLLLSCSWFSPPSVAPSADCRLCHTKLGHKAIFYFLKTFKATSHHCLTKNNQTMKILSNVEVAKCEVRCQIVLQQSMVVYSSVRSPMSWRKRPATLSCSLML